MADQSRSKADLIALFPDNFIGAIDEQGIRDLVVSCFGDYGGMWVVDGTTPQAVTATPQKLINWTANAPSVGIVPDYVNSEITIGVEGVYEGSGMYMFNGSANKTFEFELYVDSGSGYVASGTPKIVRKLGTSGDVGSAGIQMQVLMSAGDKAAVFVSSPDGGTSLTIQQATLIGKRIG
jgi:hypothetical protein